MKKVLLLLLAMMNFGHLYADEYLPLLREGVKWVYSEEFHDIYNINEGDINLSDSRKYTIELRGDTVIAGETYKKCYRICDNEVSWTELAFSKTQPVAFLREEGTKVYGRMNMVKHIEFETIYWQNVDPERYEISWDDELDCSEEGLIYDFVSPREFSLDSTTEICGITCNVFIRDEGVDEKIVEGVGYDDDKRGDLLCPLKGYLIGVFYTTTGLHHVEDADGNIIYKGAAYKDESADEYLPLLREGVKWVYFEKKYYLENPYSETEPGPVLTDSRFYTIEIKGDTVIDGNTFKKCYRYSDVDWEGDYVMPCSKTEPYAFLREEGRTVYASVYDYYVNGTGHNPFQNMLLDYSYWMMDSFDPFEDKEIKFYEFSENEYFTFEGYRPFLNQESEVYSFNSCLTVVGVSKFIEGVGFDSDICGDLLTPYYYGALSIAYQRSLVGLHHMEDAEGNIIYKGAAYTEPIAGDLDGDGLVDVEDVNAAINIILKLNTIDDYLGNADLDGNGIVDVEDVNILINKILKLE